MASASCMGEGSDSLVHHPPAKFEATDVARLGLAASLIHRLDCGRVRNDLKVSRSGAEEEGWLVLAGGGGVGWMRSKGGRGGRCSSPKHGKEGALFLSVYWGKWGRRCRDLGG